MEIKRREVIMVKAIEGDWLRQEAACNFSLERLKGLGGLKHHHFHSSDKFLTFMISF
jgi:hypothetical protein